MINQIHTQNRVDAIDWLKGLCIISIVLLHIESGLFSDNINTFIGRFMISGFYVTNGWIHGMKDDSKIPINFFIKKRLKSLGIPYLWFTSIILVFDFLFFFIGHYKFEIIVRDLYKSLVLQGIGTLWFLPVLFGGETLFILFKKKRNSLTGLLIGLMISILLSETLECIHGKIPELYFSLIKMPVRVIMNIGNALAVISGTYIISRFIHTNKIDNGILLFFATLLLLLSFWFLNSSVIESLPTYLIISLNKILIFIEPLALLFFFMNIKKENIVLKYLQYWGKNSILLMAVHYSILMELIIWIANHFLNLHVEGLFSLICFIFIMIIQYPIAELINRKFKFLIGK